MTLPRAAFERGVRRLEGAEARGFVADLLEARGYRTAVDGRVVTATAASGASTRLLVVDGPRAATAVGDPPRADAVLVTGGPLAGAAGSALARAAREARRGTDGPTVLGAETLYEWFAYAVDAEARTTLADRYLDATDPSAVGLAWRGLAGAVGGTTDRLGRLPLPSRGAAVVAVVALLVLAAATTAAPPGLLASTGPTTGGDAGTPTPRLTAVPATATPVATTADPGPPLPDVCPPSPAGAHPASLRPAVRQTATAGGLDGWRLLATQNLTRYDFDPNDQRAGLAPEVRHIAVFEAPGGVGFRLGLDRWGSPASAATAVERGGPWRLGFPWGAYALWVEWSPEGTTYEGAAGNLLAAVTTPDGVRLGGACVSALAAGPARNASGEATVRSVPASARGRTDARATR